jgi:hypothetical protein
VPRGAEWWAEFDDVAWRELTGRVWHGQRPRADTTVFVAWAGELSARGEYGHLGQYEREIAVKALYRVRPAAPGECARAASDPALFAEY